MILGKEDGMSSQPCIFLYSKIFSHNLFSALLYVAIIMPVRLAFADDSPAWEAFDWIIDAIFLGDLVVTFFSAYFDSSYRLIIDHKVHHLKENIFAQDT